MKPAARLHLIKQREYRKQCAEGRHRPDQRPGAMNPSWNNPDAGLNGGGGGGGGGDSYYYGNGIGANLQPENDYSSNSDYNDYNDYNVLENQESPNNYDNSNYDYNSQVCSTVSKKCVHNHFSQIKLSALGPMILLPSWAAPLGW